MENKRTKKGRKREQISKTTENRSIQEIQLLIEQKRERILPKK